MGFFGLGRRTSVNRTRVKSSGKVSVNGIVCSGDIEVRDGVVYADGKPVDSLDMDRAVKYGVTVVVHGDAALVDTMGPVEVKGNVNGDISTMGDVTVLGSMRGDVSTMGEVSVHADLHGDVDTLGDVRARSFQAPR